ncbi:hypothetical protein BSK56_06405 [Paenibacillus borealis]|uniref:DUF4342 domain-containing protein n=1 Tax=Paenibacillus borealis TaxID=160799 RepID=A0ABX3HJR8_PAEBO|nr:hypothetical protein BSK56_06405 [Paenibacillus borealis]
MINKLLKYYKENVSVDVLVDSHMKNVSAIVNFAFWNSFVGIIISVITGLYFIAVTIGLVLILNNINQLIHN